LRPPLIFDRQKVYQEKKKKKKVNFKRKRKENSSIHPLFLFNPFKLFTATTTTTKNTIS